MKRRLADKIVDAFEVAWEQGREDIAKRLDLIHQSLLEEEHVVTPRRRAKDEEFDPENPQSFREKNIYALDPQESETMDANLVDEDKVKSESRGP